LWFQASVRLYRLRKSYSTLGRIVVGLLRTPTYMRPFVTERVAWSVCLSQ